jgi:hypothetical protein
MQTRQVREELARFESRSEPRGSEPPRHGGGLMTASDTTARVTPYIEELLENSYARENLRDAAQNLRGAYARAQKRRARAASGSGQVKRSLRLSRANAHKKSTGKTAVRPD